MMTFAPLAIIAFAAFVRYVTYVCTMTPSVVVHVSLPEPLQSERPLSLDSEPPSLCPNSMIT